MLLPLTILHCSRAPPPIPQILLTHLSSQICRVLPDRFYFYTAPPRQTSDVYALDKGSYAYQA